MPAQLFTATYLAASFRDSGDPALRRVDAARQAMPSWLPTVDGATLVLTTAGSLLALPSRGPIPNPKDEPAVDRVIVVRRPLSTSDSR